MDKSSADEHARPVGATTSSETEELYCASESCVVEIGFPYSPVMRGKL